MGVTPPPPRSFEATVTRAGDFIPAPMDPAFERARAGEEIEEGRAEARGDTNSGEDPEAFFAVVRADLDFASVELFVFFCEKRTNQDLPMAS